MFVEGSVSIPETESTPSQEVPECHGVHSSVMTQSLYSNSDNDTPVRCSGKVLAVFWGPRVRVLTPPRHAGSRAPGGDVEEVCEVLVYVEEGR